MGRCEVSRSEGSRGLGLFANNKESLSASPDNESETSRYHTLFPFVPLLIRVWQEAAGKLQVPLRSIPWLPNCWVATLMHLPE